MQSERKIFVVRSKAEQVFVSPENVFDSLDAILSVLVNISIIRLFYQVIIATNDHSVDVTNKSSMDYILEVVTQNSQLNYFASLAVIVNIIILVYKFFTKAILVHSKQKVVKMTQNVCQVQIFPWGIQFSEYKRRFDCRVDNNEIINERQSNRKCKFIPMENIVDVIVVEQVMSYKVKSIVLFRMDRKGLGFDTPFPLKNDNNINIVNGDEKRNYDIMLVEAFSSKMVELSYVECMTLWKGISDAIQS